MVLLFALLRISSSPQPVHLQQDGPAPWCVEAGVMASSRCDLGRHGEAGRLWATASPEPPRSPAPLAGVCGSAAPLWKVTHTCSLYALQSRRSGLGWFSGSFVSGGFEKTLFSCQTGVCVLYSVHQHQLHRDGASGGSWDCGRVGVNVFVSILLLALRFIAPPIGRCLGVKNRMQARAAPSPEMESFYTQRSRRPTQVGLWRPRRTSHDVTSASNVQSLFAMVLFVERSEEQQWWQPHSCTQLLLFEFSAAPQQHFLTV